jgi:hypothetical protein
MFQPLCFDKLNHRFLSLKHVSKGGNSFFLMFIWMANRQVTVQAQRRESFVRQMVMVTTELEGSQWHQLLARSP